MKPMVALNDVVDTQAPMSPASMPPSPSVAIPLFITCFGGFLSRHTCAVAM